MIMTFKWGQCEDFETDDFNIMQEHKAEKVHIYNGISPCTNCGQTNEYEFKGLLAVGKIPSLCKECAKIILEGSKID